MTTPIGHLGATNQAGGISGKTHINLRSLQLLRAVAATSVVYFHISANPSFGAFGIEIFFVISGFVMALVVDSGQSVRKFAVSRITRIIPLYWIFTTCIFALAAIRPEILNSTTADIANYFKSIFFIPYFKENGALHPMLPVGWTLNYEMFFYSCILLSIVMARKVYVPLTIGILVVAYIGLGWCTPNGVVHSFFGNKLLFEFAFGMLAYRIYKTGELKKIGNLPLLLIALCSYVFMVYADTRSFELARIWVYGVPSAILVLSITALEEASFMKNSIVSSILAKIGDGSYVTYITHLFVVEGIRKIAYQKFALVNPYTPVGALITIGCALAVGQVVYTYCDKPLSSYFKNKLLSAKQVQSQPT